MSIENEDKTVEATNETEGDFDDEFAKIVSAVASGTVDPEKNASDHNLDEAPEKKEEPAPTPVPAKEEPEKKEEPAPTKEEPEKKEEPAPTPVPAKEEPEKKEEPAPAPVKEEPDPEILSAEEAAELAELEKEWPDIFKAVQLREKRSHEATVKAVIKEITQILGEFREGLAPLMEKHVSSEIEAHRTAIFSAHKDFETLKPDVKKWISEQPSYLKTSYEAVYNEGTTQDVIDLWSRYKKEKGLVAGTDTAPSAPPAPRAPAVDPDREDKAAALAPVTSKRTTPAPDARGVDKDDYDAAFEEASRAVQQR